MIHVGNLSKRYGHHTVLDNISFDIQVGESVALWGTNGAGKTTTIRCLLGVVPCDGDLRLAGIDVRKNGKAARAVIGYVPQEASFHDLSVENTLNFYADLKRVKRDTLRTAAERVGLQDHIGKQVSALSGGLKQRLALAISLLSDPPILMLDEPTANLDVAARREFLGLVQQLNGDGKTIVFSTHRLEEVNGLASRVLVLRDSHLVADCSPRELADKLGMQQWLRIRVPHTQWQDAQRVLNGHGYTLTPNGKALYLQVNGSGKMAPLRVLENANIHIEDFDLVDHNFVPVKDRN
jgi:ABC-type multidrug transport system ATPase subunit